MGNCFLRLKVLLYFLDLGSVFFNVKRFLLENIFSVWLVWKISNDNGDGSDGDDCK